MNQVVPPSLLFDFLGRIPRIEQLPGSKQAFSLPDSAVVFVPHQLNASSAAFELRLAWNPQGLGLAVRVLGKSMPVAGRADKLQHSDFVSIMIDTRHTANVHRATGFCTALDVLPVDEQHSRKPGIYPKVITQQREHKHTLRPENCRVAAQMLADGYLLSVWVPATELPGFEDISEIGRVGLYVIVHDTELGELPLSVGEDFPTGFDPSTWIPFELDMD